VTNRDVEQDDVEIPKLRAFSSAFKQKYCHAKREAVSIQYNRCSSRTHGIPIPVDSNQPPSPASAEHSLGCPAAQRPVDKLSPRSGERTKGPRKQNGVC
jgi:hypothetical protein